MEAFVAFRLVFWEDAQQIAVMKIQCPKACDFPCVFEVSPQLSTAYLAPWFRQWALWSLLHEDTAADTLQGVILTKVSFQTHKTLLTRWPHGNILPHLDLIATLSEVIEKLALGHGLADHLVDLGADQAPPCGAAFLLGPPFAVLPGLPTLRIFNNRKAILPTKSIGGFLHLVVILFRAVVFEAVQKRHRIK